MGFRLPVLMLVSSLNPPLPIFITSITTKFLTPLLPFLEVFIVLKESVLSYRIIISTYCLIPNLRNRP